MPVCPTVIDVAIWGRGVALISPQWLVGSEAFIFEEGAEEHITTSQTTCSFFPSCLHTFV